jgi:hypothetical protein
MMRKKTILILLITVQTCAALAQLPTKSIEKNNGYISYRVYTITKALALDGGRQLSLYNYFNKRDSTAREMVAKQLPADQLTIFYKNEDVGLQTVLSPTEFADYMVNTPGYSILLAAINKRKRINLSEDAINNLFKRYNSGPDLIKNETINIRDWEEKQLVAALSAEQLNAFIMARDEKSMDKLSSQQWKYLVAAKLNAGIDSNLFRKQVAEQNIKKTLAVMRLKGENSRSRTDSVIRALYLTRPFLLRKLELYRNEAIIKSQFNDLIAKREQLKLGEKQIDSLVERVRNVEMLGQDYQKLYKAGKYVMKPYEQDGIRKILSTVQINAYLNIKYNDIAGDDAKRIWGELQELKMTTGLSPEKTLSEIKGYELRRLVAKERNELASTKANIQSKQLAEADKPDILRALEEKKDITATSNSAKRIMAW